MSEHTKGPWVADFGRHESGEWAEIIGGDGRILAQIAIGVGDEWTTAEPHNARLMALAPELLEFFLAALDWLPQSTDIEDPDDASDYRELNRKIRRIRAELRRPHRRAEQGVNWGKQ